MLSRKTSVFRGAFQGAEDARNPSRGVEPLVFDVLGPDLRTSVLPPGLRLVLQVNPSTLTVTYSRSIVQATARTTFVRQHFGSNVSAISFQGASGGFMRLYAGTTGTAGGGLDLGGGRRDTLSYERCLDLLALFLSNGVVYTRRGHAAMSGAVRLTFFGGTYQGWFQSLEVQDQADHPFQFSLSAEFQSDREQRRILSAPWDQPGQKVGR